jgi:hypothetical protein
MKKIILVAGSIFLFSVASRAQNESPLYNEARIFMTFLKESGIVRAQYHDLYRDKNLRNDSIPLNFRTDGLDDVKFKTIFYKDKYDKRTLKRWRKLKQLPVDFHQLPSDVAPNFDLIFFYPPDHSYLIASLMPVPDPPQNYYYHLWHGYTPEATGSHYIAKLVDGRISLNTIQMIGFTF